MQVVTRLDAEAGALYAGNAYNTDFAGRTAFFAVEAPDAGAAVEACADRGDFFGFGGTLAAPAALAPGPLSGRVGAALDPCAALQIHVDLPVGGSEEVFFLMGEGGNREQAFRSLRRIRFLSMSQRRSKPSTSSGIAFWGRSAFKRPTRR